MSLSWGGLANGRIPEDRLHPVAGFAPLGGGWSSTANGSAKMRTDAAIQLSGMQRAFYRRFKLVLVVREGYRSYAGQDWYYNRYMHKLPGWTLAAFPGTSIHGWALSADLGVGPQNVNPSGEHLAWLRANAATWGFRNDVPSESWHWSFLLTPTIIIAAFIANPFADAADVPNPTEDEMGMRLIRNNTKGDKRFGEVHAISVEDGYDYHIPKGYLPEWQKRYDIATVEEHEANWFGYWLDRVNEARDKAATAAAGKVWGTVIESWNGKATAAARLAGADKKADQLAADARNAIVKAVVEALPAGVGGGQSVDTDALAKALVPAVVKGVGDDLAARLKA